MQSDWLRAFCSITWEQESFYVSDLQWYQCNNAILHFRLFPGKANDKIFQKMQKTPFLAHFGPVSPIFKKLEFSSKIGLRPLHRFLWPWLLAKKQKKTNETTLRKLSQTDRQTGVNSKKLPVKQGSKKLCQVKVPGNAINFTRSFKSIKPRNIVRITFDIA